MGFSVPFILAVLFFAAAPGKFFGIISWGIEKIGPMIFGGATLVIIGLGFMMIIGRFK